MKFPKTLAVRVADVQGVTPSIKAFALVSADGGELPRFSAGSHVTVHMPGKDRTYRNSYSLTGAPGDRSTYHIAVRRQEESRGGSIFMHDQVQIGDVLQITPPANLFTLDRLAARQILIAGGIGITPFMSYLQELACCSPNSRWAHMSMCVGPKASLKPQSKSRASSAGPTAMFIPNSSQHPSPAHRLP
jgi:ferredoxin-NADP reductase